MIGTCPYGTDYYSKSDIFWSKQTKWMLRLFPDKLLRNIMYPLHVIKDASHNVNVDKPNELNQIMEIFIKQL